MPLPSCCESLCPNYLTHHHTQIYNTTLTKSVFLLPKHSITCYTVLLLRIYFDLTGAVTVVPSTYRLTTPRGPPRKVEWANRWALLWEGRFGRLWHQCHRRHRELWELCTCMCTCVCARVYEEYICLCLCASMHCVFMHLRLCGCLLGVGCRGTLV